LQIVGTHHGYIPTESDAEETKQIIAEINALSPDILILGMGMPRQERWLLNNWDFVNANVALTGGAVFDYISGDLKRAPTWMTNYGFEWMGRLLIEPRRLWKRYVIGNPSYFWHVFKYTLQHTDRRDVTKPISIVTSRSRRIA
jgi:N-acetylglucosaminyldiphosphoundecaprenol N-acetyl-beta-D-mannosaminyltransferase